MEKNSLMVRYMKFWYGIEGPLDEYKRQQMERIGNNLFFLTWIPMDFLVLLGLILNSLVNAEVAFWTVTIGWFITFMTFSFYAMHQIKKYQLDSNEVEENNYAQAKKHAHLRGWISGLLFGIFETIFLALTNDLPLISWDSLIIFVLGTVVFGFFAGFMFANRIKVVKDNK
ncbi:DUF3278 domain-containing protein [Lactobacillus hominis]|uniref:DUF3278 domain-containing protein n=1 Tax=Lactobacillus hominis TaxID=1203033 RepID=UPI0023F14ED9|nr:DUF3278 domain-containing protein [Lactobacillus hominis]